MPNPTTPPAVGTRADGTPTDEALYQAAIGAGLDASSAAALIHSRRGQATPDAIYKSIPSNVDDATARKLTHFATGIPSGSPQATAPATQQAPMSVWQRANVIAQAPSSIVAAGDMLRGADTSDYIAAADKAVNAAAFGQGHRIAAVVQSLRDKHDLSDYRKNDDAYRASLDEDSRDHPTASAIGTTVGAVASPLNRVLAPLGAVKGGVVAGALAGSGDAQDDLLSQAEGVGAGGATGGLFGLAAHGLLSRVGRDATAEKLAGALENEASTTPEAVASNPPSFLADVLPNLTRTVRSAGAGPATVVTDALNARGAAQIPTIQSALEDGLGITRGDAAAARDAIVARRADAAKGLYQQAYAGPDVSHPAIADAMKLPAFKAAYAKGQALAAIEGAPISPQSNPATMSVRALDYLKRGLNDHIDAGTRGGTMARGEARALTARLRNVLDATDSQAPAFAAARKSFAGHSALLDAAEGGSDFLKSHVTAGDIAADLKTMTPGEAQTYRTAAANSILAKIESARGSATGKADLLSRVYDSVGGKAKLRALFPTSDAADAFEAKMDRLATENETRKFVTSGSQTVDKAAQLSDLGSSVVADAGKGVHAIGSFIWRPVAETGARVQKLGDAMSGASAAKNAAALAPKLVSPDVSALMQRLAADAARRKAAQIAAARISPRVADLLGAAIGGRPGDVR